VKRKKQEESVLKKIVLTTPISLEGPMEFVMPKRTLVEEIEPMQIEKDKSSGDLVKINQCEKISLKPQSAPKLIQPDPKEMTPFYMQKPDIEQQSYIPSRRKNQHKQQEAKWDRPHWYYFDDKAKSTMFSVIDKLRKWDEEGLFCYPVDTVEYDDYLDIIKEPLDLQTIRERIQKDHYWDVDRDLRRDILLMTTNCRNYSFEAQDIIDYCNKFDEEAMDVLQEAEDTLRIRFWRSTHKQGTRGRRSAGRPRRKSRTPKAKTPVSFSPAKTDQKRKKTKINVGDVNTKKSAKKKEEIEFTLIDDYVAVTDPEIVKKKMSTRKSRKCDGTGCQNLSDLGPFSLCDFQFQGKCECRNANVECTDACGCDPAKCCNRPVQKKQAYKLGKDLRQQEAFGIDCYTRLQLLKLFDPEQVSQSNALEFLENEYMPAINDFLFYVDKNPELKSTFPEELKDETDQAPFYVTDVLKTIMHKEKAKRAQSSNGMIGLRTETENYYTAQALCSMVTCLRYGITIKHAMKMAWGDKTRAVSINPNQPEMQTEHDFCFAEYPIYAKGAGVICTRKGGIPPNSLVTEFFGEVYLPYRWHEKEDGIRWVEKFLDSKELNFHNVNLERHQDDPDGYDLVVVDPQIKGNYACRISHQCDANLNLVPTVVNGKYVLGLYSNRHIPFGQELGFDYCAVTENEQEWKDATCLCGSPRCRGFYLEYSGNRAFSEIMKEKHTLLHRMAMLLRAGHSGLSPEDQQRLNKHGIGNSLVSDCPPWIKKFFASVLEFVEEEGTALPYLLKDSAGYEAMEFDEEGAQIQAQGISANRIVNIAITIDKIKHFLLDHRNLPEVNRPPLRKLTHAEVVDNLWNAEDSLRNNLKRCLRDHNIFTTYIQKLMSAKKISGTAEGLNTVKQLFVKIAEALGKLESTVNCKNHAAGDLLLMYAHTKTFFTSNPYNTVISAPLAKEHLNIHYTLLKRKDRLQKKYKGEFAFGQCMFWMKQTIADPTASLSADRRGTICLPCITCCYSNAKHDMNRTYDQENRDKLLDHIEQRPHEQWSTKFHWKFRWGFKKKFYGTPWFDAYLERNSEHGKKVLTALRERDLQFPVRL